MVSEAAPHILIAVLIAALLATCALGSLLLRDTLRRKSQHRVFESKMAPQAGAVSAWPPKPRPPVDPNTIVFCPGCKKAYPILSVVENPSRCPTDGCAAHPSDMLLWSDLRGLNPHLPENPAPGEKYKVELPASVMQLQGDRPIEPSRQQSEFGLAFGEVPYAPSPDQRDH